MPFDLASWAKIKSEVEPPGNAMRAPLCASIALSMTKPISPAACSAISLAVSNSHHSISSMLSCLSRLRRERQGTVATRNPFQPRRPLGRQTMPAKSKAQQKAAGAALSAKRGDTPKSKLQGASKQMASSMSEKQLEELASTKRKGKPERVS